MWKKNLHQRIDDLQTCNYRKMLSAIDKYDVISFDIFDTLVKRDVPKPTDVFVLMEQGLGIKDFAIQRIKAEDEARKKTDKEEITLGQIYNQMQLSNTIKRSELEKKEIDTEVAVACPNLDIIPVFEYCKQNKIVVLTSDMYLDYSVVEKILQKCGIVGYRYLFLSNEINRTKMSGGIYQYIKRQMGTTKILHIGNSFKADYLKAIENGCGAIKIATYRCRMERRYPFLLGKDNFKHELLSAFLNNHVQLTDEYEKFGYEVFGPLLFGYVKWLHADAVNNGVEQIYFLSRDGFIVKKIYELCGYCKDIPSEYLEVSRRSLRVPNYSKNMNYENIIGTLTVPNITNIIQLLDTLGLESQQYEHVIRKSGFSFNEQIKRDRLIYNQKFKTLCGCIYTDIIENAESERNELLKYLKQFNFEKRTAIVDIGWGGSMQKYLVESLNGMGIKSNIIGYYVGLTLKSRDNLGVNNLSAKGYAFDCLNNIHDEELESSFIGLMETLFLEQKGSVKKYISGDKGSKAIRYNYEYDLNGELMPEAVNVGKIQKGAEYFVKDFLNSGIKAIPGYDKDTFFNNLYAVGTMPTRFDVQRFGWFAYFNCGDKAFLAKPESFFKYIISPQKLKHDIFNSQWKIGFLKALLKVKLPYLKIFNILRRIANN